MIRCFFGIHKWKKMPWMRTRDHSPKPDWACLRCGKIKYNWIIYVRSIEGGGIFSALGPQYEGQPPPEGYESWEEWRGRMVAAVDQMIKKVR